MKNVELEERIASLEKRVAALEAQQQALIQADIQEDPRPEEAASKPTVLLVDDEPMIIDIARQMLEIKGFEVIVATSGQECIEKYTAQQAQIALVLLDLIMPDMGGGETFDRLKAIDPEVKVLLSSGFGTCSESDELVRKGCLGFIQKPFTLANLSEKLALIFGPDN